VIKVQNVLKTISKKNVIKYLRSKEGSLFPGEWNGKANWITISGTVKMVKWILLNLQKYMKRD